MNLFAELKRRKLERLALTSAGQVRDQLKTACRDGTTHIVIEPLDFVARRSSAMTR